MHHTLRLHTVIVGHSDLEHIEVEVQRAWGVFRPGLGYDLLQPVFQLYAQAVSPDGVTTDHELLARYYKARDALNLQLVDSDGRAIATSAIHIADYSSVTQGRGGAPLLDVLISDASYWARRLS